MSENMSYNPEEYEEAKQFDALLEKGVVKKDELFSMLKGNSPIETLLQKYDINTPEGWAAAVHAVTTESQVEQLSNNYVDIFNPKQIKGYHGTKEGNINKILSEGILTRKDHTEKYGAPQTNRWTQQGHGLISYWDLKELLFDVSYSIRNKPQIFEYIEDSDCYLLLSNAVKSEGVPMYEMGGTFAERQPYEELITGSVNADDIKGVVINIADNQIYFEDEPENATRLRIHRTIAPSEGRKILLQSALHNIPAYDISGNLIWPIRQTRIETDPKFTTPLQTGTVNNAGNPNDMYQPLTVDQLYDAVNPADINRPLTVEELDDIVLE